MKTEAIDKSQLISWYCPPGTVRLVLGLFAGSGPGYSSKSARKWSDPTHSATVEPHTFFVFGELREVFCGELREGFLES